jgi:hypothetical protein
LALALACASTYAPEPVSITEDGLAHASEVLRRAAERREDLRLEEGGLVVDLLFYEWQTRLEFDDDAELLNLRGVQLGPREVQERVLVGPRTVYVPLDRLHAVRVREWAFGTGLEFLLEGEPEPAILATEDLEEAQRLASALDLLRRARAEELASPPEP